VVKCVNDERLYHMKVAQLCVIRSNCVVY